MTHSVPGSTPKVGWLFAPPWHLVVGVAQKTMALVEQNRRRGGWKTASLKPREHNHPCWPKNHWSQSEFGKWGNSNWRKSSSKQSNHHSIIATSSLLLLIIHVQAEPQGRRPKNCAKRGFSESDYVQVMAVQNYPIMFYQRLLCVIFSALSCSRFANIYDCVWLNMESCLLVSCCRNSKGIWIQTNKNGSTTNLLQTKSTKLPKTQSVSISLMPTFSPNAMPLLWWVVLWVLQGA